MPVLQYAKALAESRAAGLYGIIGASVIKMTPDIRVFSVISWLKLQLRQGFLGLPTVSA